MENESASDALVAMALAHHAILAQLLVETLPTTDAVDAFLDRLAVTFHNREVAAMDAPERELNGLAFEQVKKVMAAVRSLAAERA